MNADLRALAEILTAVRSEPTLTDLLAHFDEALILIADNHSFIVARHGPTTRAVCWALIPANTGQRHDTIVTLTDAGRDYLGSA